MLKSPDSDNLCDSIDAPHRYTRSAPRQEGPPLFEEKWEAPNRIHGSPQRKISTCYRDPLCAGAGGALPGVLGRHGRVSIPRGW